MRECYHKQQRLRRRKALVVFITCQDDLNKFIRQQGLVDDSSLMTCNDVAWPLATYFGVGLCKPGGRITQGLPIDTLSLILTAEAIADDKTALIADTHAKAFCREKDCIDRLAHQERDTLERAVCNLGFSGWNIVLASDIDKQDDYLEIVGSVDDPNEYVRRELADIEWFRQKGVGLKIGWRLNGKNDEAAFDQKYRSAFGNDLQFLYVKPGRTMDISRPRAPPYLCEHTGSRILLDLDQDMEQKFASDGFSRNGVKKYLRNLVLLYNSVTGERADDKDVKKGAEEIIRRCLI